MEATPARRPGRLLHSLYSPSPIIRVYPRPQQNTSCSLPSPMSIHRSGSHRLTSLPRPSLPFQLQQVHFVNKPAKQARKQATYFLKIQRRSRNQGTKHTPNKDKPRMQHLELQSHQTQMPRCQHKDTINNIQDNMAPQ